MINNKDANFKFFIFYILYFIFYILYFIFYILYFILYILYFILYYFLLFHFISFHTILYYSWIKFLLLGWWWELGRWWQPSRRIWCFGNRICLYRLVFLSLKIIDFIPCKYAIFDIWFLRNSYFYFYFYLKFLFLFLFYFFVAIFHILFFYSLYQWQCKYWW